ncbi:MAG: SPOR domain-containing protein [Mariprofundus sp.]
MAGQDFAEVKAPSKSDSNGGSILPVIAILVIAGACFSAGYWLGADDMQQTASKTDVDAIEAKLVVNDAEAKILLAKIEALREEADQWKAKAEQGAHTKVGELSFYKELPKQSVDPAPVSSPPAAKKIAKPSSAVQTEQVNIAEITPAEVVGSDAASPAVVKPEPKKQADTNGYRIQIVSLKTESDAMAMQHKLTQAGFPALIHRVDLGEKGQWYRVYAGPYASKSAAQSSMQNIEKKMKLKGLLIRGG